MKYWHGTEEAWKKENKQVLREGVWRQIQAHELDKTDAGKRVKFLWQVPYEDEIYDMDGILKTVGFRDRYYLAIEVRTDNGWGNEPGTVGLGVYGETVYVKDS